MKKIIVGLLTGVILLAASMGLSSVMNRMFPGLQVEYQNPHLFRPWTDPLMSVFWIVPFLTAFVSLYIWNVFKNLVPGDTVVYKGLCFGLHFWLVTIPGMVISYSSFQVSGTMILSWTAGNLVQATIAGLIYARFLP
jgi:hypothetical protein